MGSPVNKLRDIQPKTEEEIATSMADRVTRLIKLHRLFQKQGGVSSVKGNQALGKKLGITERTVYRELRLLGKIYTNLKSNKLD